MRKFFGSVLGFVSLSSATLAMMAVGDLITGDNLDTSRGVLVGLVVFFGGIAVPTGVSAWRLFTTQGAASRQAALPVATSTTDGIDIELEARVLALAAQHAGRVTVAEVAMACSVSLDQAEKALDGLTGRGHADLHVTDEGSRVYVIQGFLSEEQKETAQDVIEHARS